MARLLAKSGLQSPCVTASPKSRGQVSDEELKGIPANEQTWELVYNLHPDWAGKGIAGASLDVVIEAWVKWIGIGTLMAVSISGWKRIFELID